MSDIFISYARPDREKAKAMAEALERQGYKVWWDPKILPGKKWPEVIEKALGEARCVVVLWSRESIGSEWVLVEANEGKQRRILLPVKIDPVNPPFGFGLIHAADLTDWTPNEPHHGFSLLLEAIAEAAGSPSANKIGQAPSAKSGTDSVILAKKPDFVHAFKNSIGMELVLIPAGSFTMGSRLSPEELNRRFGLDTTYFKREKPAHPVKIKRPFYLQTTLVTQEQWRRVMGDNPSHFRDCGEDCPVESVNWDDVKQFIKKLNEIENTEDYCLPSEADWEYACRAGSDAEFSFGDDVDRLDKFAWYTKNSDGKTHPVGEKEPNTFGLYDMHGNVWEWVEDDWHGSYKGAPDDGRPRIENPRGSLRVFRGGGWGVVAAVCRSAIRSFNSPDGRSSILGFRLSRSVAVGP